MLSRALISALVKKFPPSKLINVRYPSLSIFLLYPTLSECLKQNIITTVDSESRVGYYPTQSQPTELMEILQTPALFSQLVTAESSIVRL